MGLDDNIPSVIDQAYQEVLRRDTVHVISTLRRTDEQAPASWDFICMAPVIGDNRGIFPKYARMRVVVSETFPYSPCKIYLTQKEFQGFFHQDAETGKVCLQEEDTFPRNEHRLARYVDEALRWLKDAVAGTLVSQGDPYELPDFSVKRLASGDFPEARLVFVEDSVSFELWLERMGESGMLEYCDAPADDTYAVTTFVDKRGKIIYQPSYSAKFLGRASASEGRWVLLSGITQGVHRPAQTFSELRDICQDEGIQIYRELRAAWEAGGERSLVLVGFPISLTVGSEACEIHWQPIFFESLDATRRRKKTKQIKNRKATKTGAIWQQTIAEGNLGEKRRVPWGKSVNVLKKRIVSRGAVCDDLQSQPIALFGCGAIGCILAEALARGGTSRLYLFDPKPLSFGNLCRHTLYGSQVGQSKAEKLAECLSASCPQSTIEGFSVAAPICEAAPKDVVASFETSGYLFDCTASETAFEWLDFKANESGKRLISMFITYEAEFLAICLGGVSQPCSNIYSDLRGAANAGEFEGSDVFLRQPKRSEQVIEGAGCWHPTFPARNFDIQALMAVGISVVNENISSNSGIGCVIRRTIEGKQDQGKIPMVRTVWSRKYE